MGNQLNYFHRASHNICACTRTRAYCRSTNFRDLWTANRVFGLIATRCPLHDGCRFQSKYLDSMHPSILGWARILTCSCYWRWFKRRRGLRTVSSNVLGVLHLKPFPWSCVRVSSPSRHPPKIHAYTSLSRPVIGAFVTVRKSWRWTQWTIIFFAIFSFILTLFTRETYKKTLLHRRQKARGLPVPISPFPTAIAKLRFLVTVTFFRPLHMLVTEPIVGFLSLYVAFNFAVLFCFFAAFPYVFESQYGFDTEQTGLVFLAIGIGCVLAIPTVLLCDRYLYQPRFRASIAEGKGGVVPPEHRLYPAMMGSVGLPVGLFVSSTLCTLDLLSQALIYCSGLPGPQRKKSLGLRRS
jgi:hypothetical protein